MLTATAICHCSARSFCARCGNRQSGLYPGADRGLAQVDETRWRQKLADSIGLVAMVNSQPVGFITAIGTHIDLLFVSPDRARQGIGGALIEALCVQYPAQILTVDASITAKPCFTAHGFKVVAEQRVAAHGEWFINYRMEKRVALR